MEQPVPETVDRHGGKSNQQKRAREKRQSMPNNQATTQVQSREIQDLKDRVQRLTKKLNVAKATLQQQTAQPVAVPQQFHAQQQTTYYLPPLMSIPLPHNATWVQPPSMITCYHCSGVGHIRRKCPHLTKGPRPPDNQQPQQNPKSARIIGATGIDLRASKAYLQVRINRRVRLCLLDTGCDVTVLPAGDVMPSEIRPSAQRLLAANGTQIPVLGCTTLNAQIGSQFVDIDDLVSERVSDVMLGIDWLQANAVTWDFARSEILLNGQRFKLTAKRQGNRWCRRVVLADDTVVPARAQVDVSTKLVYDSLDLKPARSMGYRVY